MDSAIGYEEVMKASAPISFSAAKEDDVDAELSADLARAPLPRLVVKHVAVVLGPVLAAVVDEVVLAQESETILESLAVAVVRLQGLETRLLKAPRLFLLDCAGDDLLLELVVALDLG